MPNFKTGIVHPLPGQAPITPAKKSVRKNWKLITLVCIGIGIVVTTLAVVAIMAITRFFSENTIVFSAPVTVKFAKPMETLSISEFGRRTEMNRVITEISDKAVYDYFNPKPEVVKDCVATKIDSKAFFSSLRSKESTNGTNTNPYALHNYCKSKGMWNEIGYSPSTKFCFKDQEEASLYVAYYVKKNCDGKTQAQCECFWNTGSMTDSCSYSKGELSQAN